VLSLVIGVAGAGIAFFFTGFLREAGKDAYSWLKSKWTPGANPAQSDEQIVAGVPNHPEDVHPREAALCVVQCALFNVSKRKAYINSVAAYDRYDQRFDVEWSDRIDKVGNPQDSGQLIGIVDRVTLYVRKVDGVEIPYARLEIKHSFADQPMTVVFDPTSSWIKWAQ
jgi:hypothetical protein